MTHLDDGADLRAVIDRAMRDLRAPEHCGPAALVTGRRIRRRRRAASAGAGVAAAAAVTAAVAVPALGGSGGAAPESPAGPASSATTARSATADPSPATPSPAAGPTSGTDLEQPVGWWDRPSPEMLDVVRSLLPDQVTVTDAETTVETGEASEPRVTAHGGLSGILQGGNGPGRFQVILYPPFGSGVPDPVTTTDAAGVEHTMVSAEPSSHAGRIKCRAIYDRCEPITDASGDQVGRVSTDTDRGTTYHEVALLEPDGGALYFYVADSTGEKPGYEAPTAPTPPLTPEQLRTIAEDPAWTGFEP